MALTAREIYYVRIVTVNEYTSWDVQTKRIHKLWLEVIAYDPTCVNCVHSFIITYEYVSYMVFSFLHLILCYCIRAITQRLHLFHTQSYLSCFICWLVVLCCFLLALRFALLEAIPGS